MSDLQNLRAQLRAATARMTNPALDPETRKEAMREIDKLAPKLVEASKDNLEAGLKMIVDDLTASLQDIWDPTHRFTDKKE